MRGIVRRQNLFSNLPSPRPPRPWPRPPPPAAPARPTVGRERDTQLDYFVLTLNYLHGFYLPKYRQFSLYNSNKAWGSHSSTCTMTWLAQGWTRYQLSAVIAGTPCLGNKYVKKNVFIDYDCIFTNTFTGFLYQQNTDCRHIIFLSSIL